MYGEIQLTDVIVTLGTLDSIMAYHFEGLRHDVGEKLGFIETILHYALQRPELKYDLLQFMTQKIEKHTLESRGH